MHAVGEGATGRTVQDNVDEWQAFLSRTQLAAYQESRESCQTETVNIKVPPQTGPDSTITFKTPSGGTQQVRLPAQAPVGEAVAVPMVDIYTQ